MKLQKIVLFVCIITFLSAKCSLADSHYMAYSMKAAEQFLKEKRRHGSHVIKLGGITAIAGMVYDQRNKDIIIVGQANKGLPEITVDDLVVGLRSILLYDEPPLVSIDRTPDTKMTGKQAVVFRGGIDNTRFGKYLLEADIVLKKLALGMLTTKSLGIESYFSRFKRRCLQQESEDIIGSRFWFKIMGSPSFAARDGVFAIRELRIEVETEVLYATINGRKLEDITNFRDIEGDAFAEQLTNKYNELCLAYPEVGRVKTLLDLVALAKGINDLSAGLDLTYWLNKHKVSSVNIPKVYDLLRQQVKEKDANNRTKFIELNGGIELDVMVIRLQYGDVTALKEIVLQSRPDTTSVAWEVPLDGWEIPNALPVPNDRSSKKTQKAKTKNNKGCYIEAIVRDVDVYIDSKEKNPGGIYMDVQINSDSFVNETGDDELSKMLEKSRTKKNSISWKFEYNE